MRRSLNEGRRPDCRAARPKLARYSPRCTPPITLTAWLFKPGGLPFVPHQWMPSPWPTTIGSPIRASTSPTSPTRAPRWPVRASYAQRRVTAKGIHLRASASRPSTPRIATPQPPQIRRRWRRSCHPACPPTVAVQLPRRRHNRRRWRRRPQPATTAAGGGGAALQVAIAAKGSPSIDSRHRATIRGSPSEDHRNRAATTRRRWRRRTARSQTKGSPIGDPSKDNHNRVTTEGKPRKGSYRRAPIDGQPRKGGFQWTPNVQAAATPYSGSTINDRTSLRPVSIPRKSYRSVVALPIT